MLIPWSTQKPEDKHTCTIKTVHRGRVTGFLVVCAMGCEARALCRTMKQANRLATSHEGSRHLKLDQ